MNKEERVEDIMNIMAEVINKDEMHGDMIKYGIYYVPFTSCAKALCDKGYHKTIWHKVADGDLPSKTGKYLIINGCGNYDVLIYCIEDKLGPYDEDYDFEKDDNMMNLKKGFNDFDSESCEYFITDSVVAWMEIPKYE